VHTGGGAMDHLADLAVGDRIVVRSQRGDVTFEVARVTYYPRQSLADHAQQTFDQSGPNRLVLITCERWNGTSYDGNTVVVARPVDR
jgi:sortase (surface protein transpeptidase)